MTSTGLNELSAAIYTWAKGHGFWESRADLYEVLAIKVALIHSEATEALEALRKEDYVNFAEELADIIIRVLDTAGHMQIDIEKEVLNKMAKNNNRPHKHGKAF